MMMLQANPPVRTALLLIDIQNGFKDSLHWGPSRSNPLFEQNATLLLNQYRALAASAPSTALPLQHKIIHVIHSSVHPESPLHPSKPGYSIQDFATPLRGEEVIVKKVNSGFIGTQLEQVLRLHFGGKAGQLWIVGLTTDHCVSTTVRMAGNLGVCDGEDGEKGGVVLIQDATAAWKKGEGSQWFDAEIVHKVHVESLREFATIIDTVEALGVWDDISHSGR